MANNIKPTYIPFCSKHTSCCYFKGCPADFGYDPNTGNEFLIKCNKDCK